MKLTINNGITWLLIVIVGLSQAGQVSSQTTAVEASKVVVRAEVTTSKFNSPLMGREMPYRLILPPDYKTKPEQSYATVYLLHGLGGNYQNWNALTRLAEYALKHSFIIVIAEGGNGWYTDSLTVPNDKYESYIVKDLIPEIDRTYRTIPDRNNRIMAGLSMGGYGSLKFGLKYPEMFSLIGTFSGAVNAASYSENNSATAGRGIDKIMGPENSEARMANDVFKLIHDLTPQKLRDLPYIYQSCGTEDYLVKNNRDLLALINEKKVPHEYREHPGGHDWMFWDAQIREFLNLAERRLKK
ncbi:MAG TPA: alpha/beta hydrolase family protein [Pyrinomonadaceae bacterium]|nr:hypothetical protein [Acidobacteriota bacterium]HQZ96775.1 alpha/beta hydrolase family protein [Pyrinomonadaceae bacterium]